MTNVGFTGTRKGLTEAQRHKLGRFAKFIDIAHHGDCEGADAEFHDLVIDHATVHIHPPTSTSMRAYKTGDVEYPPLSFLKRNRKIVDMTDRLIACPEGFKETLRSGTWSTVRYAHSKGKDVIIIYPDGKAKPYKG